MSVGDSLSPQSDLRTNLLLKIHSCGGPPKILFQKLVAVCWLTSIYILSLTQAHALKTKKVASTTRGGPHCLQWENFTTQTDIKACGLNEMASVYLLKRINWRQLSCINFPPKINHYEASSAKHWITITLFLQGLNLLFTACYSMGLRWFLSSSMFDGKLIGLISSIFAGKSMMARPKEQRQIWTEEEDHKLIECKSRHPHLSWPNIAMLAGLERSGRSCRERWNNSLTEDNTITRLQLLYGNR